MSFAMHWTSAARAEEDGSQRIGVLGPGLAGSPDIPSLDVLAGTPGFLVDQGGVEALDQLAFDEDLAGVGRIADQVLEDVAGEDDRLRPIVVGLVVAAEGPDAVPVEVLGQASEAKSAAGLEPKDFLDGVGHRGVFNDSTVDTAVACGMVPSNLPLRR